MKLNEDKCHLILFGASNERANIHVGEAQIEESGEEKLLGITLDKKLSFKNHVKTLCKKASHALAHIFFIHIKFYNKSYIKLYVSNYYTILQGRYHGERNTMTTPWPK